MSSRLIEGVDSAAFAGLESLVFPQAWGASAFSEGDGRLGLALWQEAVCVGFIYGQQVLDEVELWRIATAPQHRRKGFAARLLTEFFLLCRRRGAGSVFLEVGADNQAAIALYQSAGFGRQGIRKGYYPNGEDAILMRAELVSA